MQAINAKTCVRTQKIKYLKDFYYKILPHLIYFANVFEHK